MRQESDGWQREVCGRRPVSIRSGPSSIITGTKIVPWTHYRFSYTEIRWGMPAAAALIDEACGIKGNILVSGDGQAREDVSIFLARFCFCGQRRQDWEREYFEVYDPHDERLPRRRGLSRQAELVRLVLSLSELPRRRS